MNIKQVTRTIMAVAIMCIASPSATHAQFGLKNVVRNAKEKAGDKVRRTINDGVEKGVNSVVDDAERRVTNAVIGLKQDEVDDGDRVLVKTKEQPYDKYTVYRSKKLVDSDDYSEVASKLLRSGILLDCVAQSVQIAFCVELEGEGKRRSTTNCHTMRYV